MALIRDLERALQPYSDEADEATLGPLTLARQGPPARALSSAA
jgi:hypothetical protein